MNISETNIVDNLTVNRRGDLIKVKRRNKIIFRRFIRRH